MIQSTESTSMSVYDTIAWRDFVHAMENYKTGRFISPYHVMSSALALYSVMLRLKG